MTDFTSFDLGSEVLKLPDELVPLTHDDFDVCHLWHLSNCFQPCPFSPLLPFSLQNDPFLSKGKHILILRQIRFPSVLTHLWDRGVSLTIHLSREHGHNFRLEGWNCCLWLVLVEDCYLPRSFNIQFLTSSCFKGISALFLHFF